MNANENEKNMGKKNHRPEQKESVDGFKNWLTIMVCALGTSLVVESYNRFGIVRGPIEIASGLMNIAVQHWWLYLTTLICYILQIVQSFLLEKMLAMGMVSEKVGMTLHALNVFFLPTAFTILARISDAHPIVGRVIAAYIVFTMSKVWSYAFVNSKLRKCCRRKIISSDKKVEDENILLHYPNNVTMKNIITYMVFTPPIQYQLCYPQRTKPDWNTFLKLCLLQLSVFYITAVISFQLIFPDMFILRAQGGGFMDTVKCVLKVTVPLNMAWFIFSYVGTYRTYLPAYAALTGFRNVIFSTHWWNSEDINTFWRKWNLSVHESLKHNVVFPLIQNGFSKRTATLIAFAIAGLLHEYANALPLGIYTGYSFVITLLEMPAGYASEYITRKFGSRYGNLLLWLYLIFVHSTALIYCAFNLPHFAAHFSLNSMGRVHCMVLTILWMAIG